jgi:hypothetical protein
MDTVAKHRHGCNDLQVGFTSPPLSQQVPRMNVFVPLALFLAAQCDHLQVSRVGINLRVNYRLGLK